MEHHQDDGDEDGDDDDEEDEDVDVDKPLSGAKHPDAVWLQPPAELCLAQRWQLCGKVGLPYHQNLHRINIIIIDLTLVRFTIILLVRLTITIIPARYTITITTLLFRYMPFQRTMLSGTEWDAAGLPYHIFALHTIWNREQVSR